MHPALADFRIEDDSVVLLSFDNGNSYRVNPHDLGRYLPEADVAKIQHALRLRKQFISKILPPTALVLLVCGILVVAGYDTKQITADLRASAHHPAAAQAATRLPASSQANSGVGGSNGNTGRATPAASQPTPASSAAAATAVVHARAAGPGFVAAPAQSVPTKLPAADRVPVPTVTIPPTVNQVVPPALQPIVQPLVQPLAKTVPALTRILPLER